MLKGIKNTANMMNQARKAKAQQDKLSKLLSGIQVSGVSKNGKVTVTITGEQKIVAINIDPTLIAFVYENFTSQNKEDTQLSKSIIEATEDAIGRVQGEVVKKMQETGSLEDLMGMLSAASGQ
jgi:DNA-binding protein YbaB